MLNLSYVQVKSAYLRKNYKFFVGDYNLNIFGVRGKDRIVNAFDDTLGVAYQEKGKDILFLCAGTVDPGLPWLIKPMEPFLGAAAVKEGQYLSLWRLGVFRGVPALVQINPIVCYRDNNRDDVFDFIPDRISRGNYGIFLHEHYQPPETATKVDTSSAGCIVPASRLQHRKIIELCRAQIRNGWGNTFTFTLFDETEL